MKALLRAGFLIALALAGAIAVWTVGRRGVDTDLFSMVGTDSGRGAVLADLDALSADAVRVLCADAARAADLRARYPFDPPLEPSDFLGKVRTHGRGLLAPKARELLEKGDFARIRRGATRRDYSGVGLFSKADDPYYFLNDFVVALKALAPENLPEGAVLLTGRGRVLDAAVPGGGLLALVREAERDEGLALSGAPFHTAIAQRRTIREINVLAGVSLLAVLVFGWLLFRSFRFALPMAAAVVCALVAASGAVCLMPARPHALTFLFGTTLIGLGVDYCYHALSPERMEPGFRRRLAGALATTCLAFAPLLVSSARVLRQMSVFTIAGLVATYAFVLLFTRPGASAAVRALPGLSRRGARVRAAGCAALALAGLLSGRPALSSDPAAFHRPAAVMARGEARMAALTGGAAGMRLVDFTQWQEENAALKARLGDAPRGAFLTLDDLPSGIGFRRGGHDYLALPEAAAAAVFGPCGEAVDLKGLMRGMFADFLSESAALAGGALLLLALGAFALFGRRAFRVFLPPAGACAMTLLTLGLLHEPITFFHVLCFFILVGLGIDYAIFSSAALGPDPRGVRPPGAVVFFSFLTSLAGFGLLAFTSFPVTRSMGLTLALGLFWAYVLALPRESAGRDGGPSRGAAWHEQKEQSAGRLRILLLWHLYRFLGKDAAKILFLPGYLFIYPFCTSARRALRKYYAVLGVKDRSFRHILSFAWSLFDKTDACTLCKNPPTFALAGDTGWTAGGCFLLSTHLGCIEVMPALRKTRPQAPRVHAFQQMGHDAVFTQVFAARLDAAQLTLHAVEDIGVETAVEMSEAIRAGEIVLMAGDRLAAAPRTDGAAAVRGARSRELRRPFLGHDCAWPKGVFRFAKMMEAPVYAIVCAKTGWNAYELRAARLGDDLLAGYAAFLEANVRRYPYQWYQFYDFFGKPCKGEGK